VGGVLLDHPAQPQVTQLCHHTHRAGAAAGNQHVAGVLSGTQASRAVHEQAHQHTDAVVVIESLLDQHKSIDTSTTGALIPILLLTACQSYCAGLVARVVSTQDKLPSQQDVFLIHKNAKETERPCCDNIQCWYSLSSIQQPAQALLLIPMLKRGPTQHKS